jgi:hypothetical protein
MKRLPLLFAALLTLYGGHLHAQAPPVPAKPELPPGPLIQQKAPDFTEWTITQRPLPNSKTPGDSVGAPPSAVPGSGAPNQDPNRIITRRIFTRTGKILNLQYTDEFNKTWNVWMQESQRVLAWPDGKSVTFVVPPQPHEPASVFYIDLSKGDFEGFAWISAENYKGLSMVNGKNCLLFSGSTGNEAGFPIEVSAVIDLKTRLPVSLDDEQGEFTYEFKTVADTLTLPENVQKFILSQQRKEDRLKKIPGPAF